MTGDPARRGEVWWAELGEPGGSEPGYRRPILVVSSDTFNATRIDTVIALAITSNPRLAAMPGNVRLMKRQSGLPRDSVVNVSQIATLDKRMLVRMVRRLPDGVMHDVESGMRLVLDLIR